MPPFYNWWLKCVLFAIIFFCFGQRYIFSKHEFHRHFTLGVCTGFFYCKYFSLAFRNLLGFHTNLNSSRVFGCMFSIWVYLTSGRGIIIKFQCPKYKNNQVPTPPQPKHLGCHDRPNLVRRVLFHFLHLLKKLIFFLPILIPDQFLCSTPHRFRNLLASLKQHGFVRTDFLTGLSSGNATISGFEIPVEIIWGYMLCVQRVRTSDREQSVGVLVCHPSISVSFSLRKVGGCH